MTDSTFEWPRADEPRLAVGRDEAGTARPPFRPMVAKAAAGGMFTTAPDYLRFLDNCLVHERRMFVPQAHIDDELAWGLGWGIEIGGLATVWQWGNDPGYKNFVIGLPTERFGIVVLTNGDRGVGVYSALVLTVLPGPHPSLQVSDRPGWKNSWQASS